MQGISLALAGLWRFQGVHPRISSTSKQTTVFWLEGTEGKHVNTPGFLNFPTTYILNQIIFHCKGLSVHCWMFRNRPGLWPVDTDTWSSPTHPLQQPWQSKPSPDIAKCPSDGKISSSWEPLVCTLTCYQQHAWGEGEHLRFLQLGPMLLPKANCKLTWNIMMPFFWNTHF